MFQYDANLWLFIMWNLLAIILVGIVYFVVKEAYRIRGGTLGKLGILVVGSFIGIIVALIHIYLSMEFYMTHESWILSNDVDAYLIYNGVLLSPSIIIIIMFVTYTDRRLLMPLFAFQVIALLIRIPKPSDNAEIEQTILFTSLLFELIEYSILAILLYFIPSIDFIKKNAVKIFISLTLYILVMFVMQMIFHETISGIDVSGGFGQGSDWIKLADWISLQTISIAYLISFALIQLIFIYAVEKVYSNFSALETFSTQDDVSYYKMSLAQNKLIKIIDEKKIKFGLIALFQIKTDDDKLRSRTLERIRINTETKYKTTFFFKASAIYHGAFYELPDEFELDKVLKNNKNSERSEDDVLYEISRELKRISIEEDINIAASGSIYGLHSNSLPDLIEHARFLMSPIVSRANSNQIIIYDFKRVKERLNETNQVRNLPVDIEGMNISYLRGVSNEEIFYPNIFFENNEEKLSDITKGDTLNHEQKNILLRHIAYQTLRKFEHKDSNLMFFYPLEYLSSNDFKIKDFIKKINRYIIENKVIIGIDTSLGEFGDSFDVNVKLLREKGIRFAIVNPRTVTQEEHDKINPDFIVDPDVDKNPLKIKQEKLKINTNARILNPNLVI